jgi:hypothetical protein
VVCLTRIGHVIIHFLGRIDRQLRLSNAFDSWLGQEARIGRKSSSGLMPSVLVAPH